MDLPTRGALQPTPGPETFDRMEAREPMTVGSAQAAAKGMPYAPCPDVVVGDPQLRADAERLGFRWVGCYEYHLEGASVSRQRESWVDPLGIVRLSMRRALTSDRVERKMSLYLLSSTFDDGCEITTWPERVPPLISTPRIDERGGTGRLAPDYEAHLDAVRRHAASGTRPLTFPDLATIVRAAHWDHFRLRPGRIGHGHLAGITRALNRFSLVYPIVIGALVIWRIWRAVHRR